MATTITVTVALSGVYTFNTTTPSAILFAPTNAPNATSFNLTLSAVIGGQIATVVNAPLNPPPGLNAGNQTLTFVLSGNDINPILGPEEDGMVLGLANFSFNSTPVSSLNGVQMVYQFSTNTLRGVFNILIRCIHGSSLITMKDNELKRIDQIKPGDFVLSDGKYAKVEDVAHCWLTFLGIDHDCVVFEPNSIEEGFPNKRLIIDPGHPMCTKKEYEEKGLEALRPAGTFLEELGESDLIYVKKWTDPIIQEDPSRRYDLILEEPYNTYTANGIIVQTYGYKDHRYKNFV